MHFAMQNNDMYQSFSTAASCQYFYDTMCKTYKMKKINLMEHFDINDLSKSERVCNIALDEYKELYIKTNTKILHYDNVEKFELDYLK